MEARRLGQKGVTVQAKPLSRQPSAGAAEEEKSIVDVKIDGRNVAAYTTCAACRTRQSNVWWKAPKGLFTAVLCDDCGVHWRKYGDLNLKTPKEDSLPSTKQRMATAEKREGTPLPGPIPKRMKVCVELSFSHVSSYKSPLLQIPTGSIPTPQPPPLIKHVTCQCCRKSGALGKVIKCIQCSVAIHAG